MLLPFAACSKKEAEADDADIWYAYIESSNQDVTTVSVEETTVNGRNGGCCGN